MSNVDVILLDDTSSSDSSSDPEGEEVEHTDSEGAEEDSGTDVRGSTQAEARWFQQAQRINRDRRAQQRQQREQAQQQEVFQEQQPAEELPDTQELPQPNPQQPAVVQQQPQQPEAQEQQQQPQEQPPEPASQDEDNRCSICFSSMQEEGDHRPACLRCGHVFGKSCLEMWLETGRGGRSCPSCNKRARQDSVIVLFDLPKRVEKGDGGKGEKELQAKVEELKKEKAQLEAKLQKEKSEAAAEARRFRRTIETYKQQASLSNAGKPSAHSMGTTNPAQCHAFSFPNLQAYQQKQLMPAQQKQQQQEQQNQQQLEAFYEAQMWASESFGQYQQLLKQHQQQRQQQQQPLMPALHTLHAAAPQPHTASLSNARQPLTAGLSNATAFDQPAAMHSGLFNPSAAGLSSMQGSGVSTEWEPVPICGPGSLSSRQGCGTNMGSNAGFSSGPHSNAGNGSVSNANTGFSMGGWGQQGPPHNSNVSPGSGTGIGTGISVGEGSNGVGWGQQGPPISLGVGSATSVQGVGRNSWQQDHQQQQQQQQQPPTNTHTHQLIPAAVSPLQQQHHQPQQQPPIHAHQSIGAPAAVSPLPASTNLQHQLQQPQHAPSHQLVPAQSAAPVSSLPLPAASALNSGSALPPSLNAMPNTAAAPHLSISPSTDSALPPAALLNPSLHAMPNAVAPSHLPLPSSTNSSLPPAQAAAHTTITQQHTAAQVTAHNHNTVTNSMAVPAQAAITQQHAAAQGTAHNHNTLTNAMAAQGAHSNKPPTGLPLTQPCSTSGGAAVLSSVPQPCPSLTLLQRFPLNGGRCIALDAVSGSMIASDQMTGAANSACCLSQLSLVCPQARGRMLLPPACKSVKDICLAPDGQLSALATQGMGLLLLSQSGNQVAAYTDLGAQAWSCAWSERSEHQIYVGLANGTVSLIDLRNSRSDAVIDTYGTTLQRPVQTLVSLPSRHTVLGEASSDSHDVEVLAATTAGVWGLGGVGAAVTGEGPPDAAARPLCVQAEQGRRTCEVVARNPRTEQIACSWRSPYQGGGVPLGSVETRAYHLLYDSLQPSELLDSGQGWAHAASGDMSGHESSYLYKGFYHKLEGHTSSGAMTKGCFFDTQGCADAGSPGLWASADEATCTPWLWCLESGQILSKLMSHSSPVVQLQAGMTGSSSVLAACSRNCVDVYVA